MRWSSKLFATLAVLAVFLAIPVHAQDSGQAQVDSAVQVEQYERYRLPAGRRCESEGQTYQCFSVDEYVELLNMDNDLRYAEATLFVLRDQIEVMNRVAVQLRLALIAAEEQVDTLQLERVRLLAKWEEENKLRLEAENRPRLGSWIAWGLVLIETVVIASMAIGQAVRD